MIIFQQFTFDSAHFLPLVQDGHKCKNVHGHTYHISVYLEGELDPEAGWVIDFSDVKKVIAPVIATIDHTLLNGVVGLENPTAENLAIWLWNKIKPELSSLKKIEIKETPTSGVIYKGY